MDLVTREQWGARAPRTVTPLDLDQLRGLAVHYSASNYDAADDHAACDDRVRGIQNFHMDGNGWADIAYSFLTCKHGTVFEGRGWGVRTAANGTNPANDHYHATCFLGADKEGRDDVLPAGRLALAAVIAEGRSRYPHAWEVRPHSDFKATACPGNELRAWLGAGMPVDADGNRPPDMPTDLIVVNAKPVDIEECPLGGYWIACEDGGVFNFSGAGFFGSLGGVQLNAPVVEMVGTGSGQGYRLFAADGGVFDFGDAIGKGSLGGTQLNAPIVAAAAPGDPTVGYWMLGGDGGVFAMGSVPFGGRVEYRGS